MSLGEPVVGAMNLGVTDKLRPLLDKVRAMVRDDVIPLEHEFEAEIGKAGSRFAHTPRQLEILDGLKAKARERGLWNFWLTDSEKGYGLSTVEYAYLAEEMGKSPLGAEVFNCSAPDTGNMEVFERYGTPAQKERWLEPLLRGEIRSAYLMTEPAVASSDATNISLSARLDGDHWVLNGEKWWASGAGDPRCKIYIVMCVTDPDAGRHQRHSMILVPAGTPGVTVLRAMQVFGEDDAPHGHMHIRFENVRVPADSLVHERGKGFEVAQGRLGPGRIHHCMRAIGQAERALEILCRRATSRVAFGKKLAELGANYDIIAESRMEIEMARLLCLKAAYMMDTVGTRAAAPWISQIKVVAPRIAIKITDEAIQMHGAAGISQDFPLAGMWKHLRTLRLVDGPDAVHRRVIAKTELKRYTNAGSRAVAGAPSSAVAALDQEALGRWMSDHVPGFAGPLAAEKFPGGQSNPTFLVTSPSGRYVLRRKPPGTLLKSAHAVDREFRVISALAGTAVPTPRALAFCADETVLGTIFYVMEHVEGRVFWDPAMPDSSPEERAAVYDAMNAALAALHKVDPAVVGLADFGRPGDYFARQLARWSDQYRASETQPIPAMDRLIAWLGENRPPDDGRVSLVHGDYRIDNMIFSPAEAGPPRLLAIIDWELSTLGHPFSDIAYQCMQWRLPHEGDFRGLAGVGRGATGIPDEDAYVAAYCARMGIDGIPTWTFCLAFSFFRLAAILQGVLRRALDGNASNPERGLKMGRAVPLLAQMACDLVEAKR